MSPTATADPAAPPGVRTIMARISKLCQNLYPGLVLQAGPPTSRGIPSYVWVELTRDPGDMLKQRWQITTRKEHDNQSHPSVHTARRWFDSEDHTASLTAAVLLCLDSNCYTTKGDPYTLSVIECNQYNPSARADTTLDYGRDPIGDLIAASLPKLIVPEVPL